MVFENLNYDIFKTKTKAKFSNKNKNSYIKKPSKQNLPNQNYNSKLEKHSNHFRKLDPQIVKFHNILLNKCLRIPKVISSNYNYKNYLRKE